MATLRDIRRRIRSVRSTQQITKAMEMVAASKLRRSQNRAIGARPYARGMEAILDRLAAGAADADHPLFRPRPVRSRLLVVMSADRGLCGAYNTNVMRAAEQFLRSPEGKDTQLFLVGRKARDYFKRRQYPIAEGVTELPAEARLDDAKRLSERLQELFLSGQTDAVDLLYTKFVNIITRRIVREPFLPITPIAAAGRAGGTTARPIIFEPDVATLLHSLLPRYATTRLLQALAESLTSEHAARMVAMSSAQKNAGELIDSLVLLRNRLRQAGITKELAEIVGGAEALA
jgi:F-type H+-transporting ATPase subunit gamma